MIASAIDTNALASGFVRRNLSSPPVLILDAWLQQLFVLVTSEHILTELARTFSKPYFAQHIFPKQAQASLALVRARAAITPLTETVRGVATQPEDDLVLATALSGQAGHLVTGDRKLQQLGAYRGVIILSSRAFLDWLQTQDAERF